MELKYILLITGCVQILIQMFRFRVFEYKEIAGLRRITSGYVAFTRSIDIFYSINQIRSWVFSKRYLKKKAPFLLTTCDPHSREPNTTGTV